MKKAAPSTAKVAGRVALFSASAASHPKVNPLFRPAQFHPIPAAKSVVNDVPALDNDAILARHDDNKEWSREEIAESMKNNTLSAWAVHNPDNMVHISHGEGIYLYDQDGKKYIDFNSQAMCTNQGHTAHPTVIDAIMKQLKEVCYE